MKNYIPWKDKGRWNVNWWNEIGNKRDQLSIEGCWRNVYWDKKELNETWNERETISARISFWIQIILICIQILIPRIHILWEYRSRSSDPYFVRKWIQILGSIYCENMDPDPRIHISWEYRSRSSDPYIVRK